ncbi:MAG: sulfatase-like hydrolase/transferase [Synergistaceae bacterium]
MPKKNVILLIIDSYNYSRIRSNDEGKKRLAPFFKKLEEKSIYATNMFSQAPYTEAAEMSLYCGQNVLDYGGYLKRFADTPLTIFEAFKSAGYDTYYNSYQPQCFPSSVKRGITDIYNNVGFDFNAIWSYRLSLYSEMYKKKEITNRDYQDLEDILEDNFKEWYSFIDGLRNKDKSLEMICKNSKTYDEDSVRKSLDMEYSRYLLSKKKYIQDILELGFSHPLFSIPAYKQDNKVTSKKTVEYVRKELYFPFIKIYFLNLYYNFKNNKFPFKKMFNLLKAYFQTRNSASFKNILKFLFYTFNIYFDTDLFERISKNYSSFKNAPSMDTHCKQYFSWLKKRVSNNPYFACIHVDDIHNPEIFFTYDSEDIDQLSREILNIKKFLGNIPKTFKGSITHDLSLMYINNIFESFVHKLEELGAMEDTIVCVTADHGYSFSYNPVRESYITNFYLENYRVPFYLFGVNISPLQISSLVASKDIPVTLLDICNLDVDKSFTGTSLLTSRDTKDNINYIEYLGGGCPHLLKRDLQLAVFDDRYMIATILPLREAITIDKIQYIYNLKKDPLQKTNLLTVPSFDKNDIMYLFNKMERRFESLKEKYLNVGADFDN